MKKLRDSGLQAAGIPNRSGVVPGASVVFAFCAALLLFAPATSRGGLPEVAVTACGQTVAGAVGYLTGNLDCTGSVQNGVNLDNGQLDLRGFTLTTGLTRGVYCVGDCVVFSSVAGGLVTGAGQVGIGSGYDVESSLEVHDLTVTNVGLSDSESAAISGFYMSKSVVVRNVTISNISGNGIFGSYQSRKFLVESASITGCAGYGIDGGQNGNVKVLQTTVSNNSGIGIFGSKVTVVDSTISNNADDGVSGLRVKMKGVNVSDNPTGVYARGLGVGGGASVRESTLTNNGVGIRGYWATLSLKDSTVTGGSYGVYGDIGKFKINSSTISGADYGVYGSRGPVSVSGAQIQNNAIHGIVASGAGDLAAPVKVKSSIVTGNGTDPGCGVVQVCADLYTDTRPKLVYEAGVNECILSHVPYSSGTNWGVCELDCQNGVVNPGETCDDGAESMACDDDCTAVVCQDGNFNAAAGEECDDGNADFDDGCTPACIREYCGDGTTQGGIGEACDDGAINTATCDADCTVVLCGDGLRNKAAGEQCDDGNANAGDGCSATCQKE